MTGRVFLFSFFCSWEKILAKGINFVAWSGTLVVRVAEVLRFRNQAHEELLECLGPRAPVHFLWQWCWYLKCKPVSIFCVIGSVPLGLTAVTQAWGGGGFSSGMRTEMTGYNGGLDQGTVEA